MNKIVMKKYYDPENKKQYVKQQALNHVIHLILSTFFTIIVSPYFPLGIVVGLEFQYWLDRILMDPLNEPKTSVAILDTLADFLSWSLIPLVWLL